MENSSRRANLLICRDVQGALMGRTIVYWVYCLVAVSMMVFCWSLVQTRPTSGVGMLMELAWRYGPAIVASSLLLPIVVIDSMKLSHRIVGPLFRLHNAMRRLAAGDDVEPISFREGDFWHDLADDFNRVVARVDQLKQGQEPVEEQKEEPVSESIES